MRKGMPSSYVYNRKQWEWIRQKRREGYGVKECAKFLGVATSTVTSHCPKPPLAPLETHRKEFDDLA